MDEYGHISWVKAVLSHFTKTQRQVKYEAHISKQILKIGKYWRRNYIAQGEIISFTHVFSVPKGADYIRMVYNDT